MTAADMTTVSHATTARQGLSGATLVILGVLLAIVVLVVAAILIGPVVLTIAALTLVPVMFAIFLAISRP